MFISPAEGWMHSSNRGKPALCKGLKCVFGQEPSTLRQPSLCMTYFSTRCIELYTQLAAVAAAGKVLTVVTIIILTCLHGLHLTPETCHFAHIKNIKLKALSSARIPDLQRCLNSQQDLGAAQACTHTYKALPCSYTSPTWRAISFCCFSQAAHCCPIFSSFVFTYSV